MWYRCGAEKLDNKKLKEIDPILINLVIDNVLGEKLFLKGVYSAPETNSILFNSLKKRVKTRITDKYGPLENLRNFTSKTRLAPLIVPIVEEVVRNVKL